MHPRELKRVMLITSTEIPVVRLMGNRETVIPLVRDLLSNYPVLCRTRTTNAANWQTMCEYLTTVDLTEVKDFLLESLPCAMLGIERLIQGQEDSPLTVAMIRYAELAPSKHAILHNAADASRTLRRLANSVLED